MVSMREKSARKGRSFAAYAAAGAAMAGVGTVAQAQFSGPYDHSNWTFNPGGTDAFFFGDVNSATITGGDNLIGGTALYTIAAVANGTVSFDWNYSSVDEGNWDYGGYYLNGSFTILANNASQGGGQASFNVSFGDEFGFFVHTQDGFGGPGILTISNFSAPVPAPAALALLAAGAIGRLRRNRARTA